MRVFGLETYIGRTVSDVSLDRDFEQNTDIVTIEFEDGGMLQFWAIEKTAPDEGTHPDLQFHVGGYEGSVDEPVY